jgi:release factor glutamine methyltransferase
MPPAEIAQTVGRLLADATARLRAAESPTPRLDAELLVSHAVERDRAWLLGHPEHPVDADAAATIAGWIERRATGEPVAYVRGFKEWLTLRVATDPRALIPRPETELLAEEAIREIAGRLARDETPITAWEVATGSGAIGLALAQRFRTPLALGRLRLVASDVSADALELASENLARHGLAGLVTLACADLLEPAGETLPRPHVVVANLPYLTTGEVDAGFGSLAFEPRLALDGGPDGLSVVRRLLAQIPTRSEPGSVTLIEIGAGQEEGVRAALPATASASSLVDLAGLPRVVRVEMP